MELNVPTIYKGSILELDVDVIVNPANSFLMNGAGLAKAIEDCAQGRDDNLYLRQSWREATVQELRNEYNPSIAAYNAWRKNKKLIPYGGAVLSPPGALCRRFKGIIHAVGPIWGGGDYHEEKLLYTVFAKCLAIAEDEDFESIAFPAISAGIFGCPIELVAKAAAAMATITDLAVVFALMDDEHIKAFRVAIDRALGVVDVQ